MFARDLRIRLIMGVTLAVLASSAANAASAGSTGGEILSTPSTLTAGFIPSLPIQRVDVGIERNLSGIKDYVGTRFDL